MILIILWLSIILLLDFTYPKMPPTPPKDERPLLTEKGTPQEAEMRAANTWQNQIKGKLKHSHFLTNYLKLQILAAYNNLRIG